MLISQAGIEPARGRSLAKGQGVGPPLPAGVRLSSPQPEEGLFEHKTFSWRIALGVQGHCARVGWALCMDWGQ